MFSSDLTKSIVTTSSIIQDRSKVSPDINVFGSLESPLLFANQIVIVHCNFDGVMVP